VSVAEHQGGPDRGGDQPLGAADVEDLTVAAEDGWDQVGVTGQPADDSGRQVEAIDGGGRPAGAEPG
jgi:hypothetical protein